jgi:hypothetical protein
MNRGGIDTLDPALWPTPPMRPVAPDVRQTLGHYRRWSTSRGLDDSVCERADG